MSLLEKLKAQHEKSKAQMQQAKEEMRKAKEDIREGWSEVKRAGKEYFQGEGKQQLQAAFQELKEEQQRIKAAALQDWEEGKQYFKRAASEFKTGMSQAKEILLTRCPQCNSARTKKQRPYNLFLFLLSLALMIFGTMLFGVLGFILGSLLMIIPGWQSLRGVVSPTYRCKECGHSFKP